MDIDAGLSEFAGRRCVVVGGGGFIGTNLCHRLLSLGAEVVLVSPALVDPEPVREATWIRAMLHETETYGNEIRPGDFVFHLVSTTAPASSNLDPAADVAQNVLPTLKLLDHVRDRGVRKLVFLSSGGTVYGPAVATPTTEAQPNDPVCSYGIHKLAIEKYLALYRHLHGLEAVSLRVSNPFGPYQLGGAQGLIATVIRKALRRETITIWGDGSVIRDYIYVEDLVAAILRASLTDRKAPTLFNVGSGQGRSIREILDAVQRLHDEPLDIVFEPARATDVPVSVLDISRARQYMHWEPTTGWEPALEKTYQWSRYRER